MHRLPLLRMGVPLGRADRGMGLARSQDSEVHALRRPHGSARPYRFSMGRHCPATRAKGSAKISSIPACVKACPADALLFGTRDEMLTEARKRISNHPEKYIDHIYGEKERAARACCTFRRCLSRSSVFPTLVTSRIPVFPACAIHAVPPAVLALGALLGGTYAFLKRRAVGNG